MTNLKGQDYEVGHLDLNRRSIENVIPGTIQEEYPLFVEFIKGYFEYLNSTEGFGNLIRDLKSITDPDLVTEAQLEALKQQYGPGFPQTSAIDDRVLIRVFEYWYRSKGTEEAIKAYFRLFLNTEAEVVYPKDNMLIVDGGNWDEDRGEYKTTESHIDETTMVLQDDYFYQQFSYLVKSGVSIKDWGKTYERLAHMAGWLYFGKVEINSIARFKYQTYSPTVVPGFGIKDARLLILGAAMYGTFGVSASVIIKIITALAGSSQTYSMYDAAKNFLASSWTPADMSDYTPEDISEASRDLLLDFRRPSWVNINPVYTNYASEVNSRLGAGETPLLYVNFYENAVLSNGTKLAGYSSLPGYAFARSSPATTYAKDSTGKLIPFAANVPRITDLGLLIEIAKTNLCLQSETFDNGSWVKDASSVSANSTAAPTDDTTADTLIEASGTAVHRIKQSFTKAASALDYVFSVFIKPNGRRYVRMLLANAAETAFAYAYFDLQTGTVLTTGTTTFTNVSSHISTWKNGYYRVQLSCMTNTDTSLLAAIELSSDGTSVSYNGDGTSGAYLFGAQLEQTNALYASSYIPTTTTSVSRSADTFTFTSPITSWATPVTFYAKARRSTRTFNAVQVAFHMDDGTSTNFRRLHINASSLLSGGTQSNSVASSTVTTATAIAYDVDYKWAFRGELNNDITVSSGQFVGTLDTASALPLNTPTTVRLHNNTGASQHINGYITEIAIFDVGLTVDQMLSLTR